MPSIPLHFLFSSLSRLVNRSSPSKTLIKASAAFLARLTRTGLLQTNLPSPAAATAAVNDLPFLLSDAGCTPAWNAVVAALSRHGYPSLALQTLSFMHRLALPLDSYSLCSALFAAASIPATFGRQIHAYASKSGEVSSIFVDGALISFYARTGAIHDAHKVFDEIPIRNTVCLNALLNGYVETKLWIKGLSLFGSIDSLMIHPDCLTISAVLKICAEVSVIGLGMQCHAYLIRRIDVMGKDVFLLSSLVEMYGKCGLVGKARLVFGMSKQGTGKEERDVVLWTSMLNAYGLNGRFDDVISTFEEMLVEGTEPDEVVMLVVLSGCVHSGNVKKGLVYLESMMKKYGLAPRRKHYSCVIDMLCRAGELENAWNFGNEITLEDDYQGRTMSAVTAWGAILTACRDSGNVKIGKFAFLRAIQLDPDNVGVYIELSNLYASVEMWDELAELRKLMLMKGMKKDIGCSRLEVMN